MSKSKEWKRNNKMIWNFLLSYSIIKKKLICGRFLKTCIYSLWKIGRVPPEVFYKKRVFKNFAKFTETQLCQSLFFNKVAGSGLQFYQKRDSDTGVFLWPISQNTTGQMLLAYTEAKYKTNLTWPNSEIYMITWNVNFL